jgi:hypothetical protein
MLFKILGKVVQKAVERGVESSRYTYYEQGVIGRKESRIT